MRFSSTLAEYLNNKIGPSYPCRRNVEQTNPARLQPFGQGFCDMSPALTFFLKKVLFTSSDEVKHYVNLSKILQRYIFFVPKFHALDGEPMFIDLV